MNNNTTSQFMDKQIMDLSNSQNLATSNTNNTSTNDEFIDFMNRPQEKKDDIVPSYDFMPIRPAVGSSSSPPPARSANFDSGEDDAPVRTWNSFDSKTNASAIRNYSSVDAEEPAKFILGKNQNPSNAPFDMSLISEIDRTMKKYMDNLTHAVDNMSARLSQLETRSRHLENSVDDLKVSVGENHGSTDGKMRMLENMLREVQTGVQVIKDKQEIVEAKLRIANMQRPKTDQEVETNKTQPSDPNQAGSSPNQHFPNAPPPQTLQPQFQPQPQLPNQFPQNQAPSVPHYQVPENPNQNYQIPPTPPQHPPHSTPPPLAPQHQYQPPLPSQPQYSHPPPPPSSQPQPPLGHHHPEDTPYTPNQNYPPTVRPPPPHPPTGVQPPPPPSQQYYGYEPPSNNRPGPGYHGEPFPYSSSPSQYNSGGSPMKPPHQQISSSSGYPQLPTARILPQAVPTASAVGSGTGSGSGPGSGSGNRVPIDDVVDRVTNMGFPREQVKATVRKLTENGQAVDLNVVLDKLMNDGDGQGPRAWFGQ